MSCGKGEKCPSCNSDCLEWIADDMKECEYCGNKFKVERANIEDGDN